MRFAGSTNMTLTPLAEDLETELLMQFALQVASVRPKLAERLCELLDNLEFLTNEEGLAFSGFEPEESEFLLCTLVSLLNSLGVAA